MELLVVMAIIGILAGVVLVSMSGFREHARENAALQTASSVMPAAMKCALEGKNMNVAEEPPVAGQPICEGSSFDWPSLGTSSTQGWVWGGAEGDSANPNDYGYWALGPDGEVSGGKYIGCPVTATYWTDASGGSIQPGTCVIDTVWW